MNTYYLLLVELAASVGLSLAVLAMLSQPLVNVLRLMCPHEQAAIFWLTYTRVLLMITPLLLVLIIGLFSQDNARLAIIAALSGLVLGLWSIGSRINEFIAKEERKAEAT